MEQYNFFGYNWTCCMEGYRLIHPDTPYIFYDKEKIFISENGVELTLGSPSQDTVTYWDGREFHPQYGGGLLRSVEIFGYGTFEAEIIMPSGSGLWPAFWMCGVGSWPGHGEIDVCEGYSDNRYFRFFTPYFPWINPSWKTTTNVHYSDGEHRQIGSRGISIFRHKDPETNTIKYKCIWTPNEIIIYIGDKEVRRDTKAIKYFLGDKVRVIFDLMCENPEKYNISMQTPMVIKNFTYKPL